MFTSPELQVQSTHTYNLLPHLISPPFGSPSRPSQHHQGRLWDAVFSGDINQVEAALTAGASLSAGPSSLEALMGGRYPLHAAAAGNHAHLIRLMVARWGDLRGALGAQMPWPGGDTLHAISNKR